MSEASKMRRGNKKDKQDKRLEDHAKEFFNEWKRTLPQLLDKKYHNLEWEECPIMWKNNFKRQALGQRIDEEAGLLRKKRHLKAEGIYKLKRKDKQRIEKAGRKQR